MENEVFTFTVCQNRRAGTPGFAGVQRGEFGGAFGMGRNRLWVGDCERQAELAGLVHTICFHGTLHTKNFYKLVQRHV